MNPSADHLTPTPSLIEGPYWKPGSPQRTALSDASTAGKPLRLLGRVLSRKGKPLGEAWIDVWQCDGEGVYDNAGFHLRGHQFTGPDGSFEVETVVPSEYVDVLQVDDEVQQVHRTSHIHLKVKAPNRDSLTTQLYFPGEPFNLEDKYFSPACLLNLEETAAGLVARVDVVLE